MDGKPFILERYHLVALDTGVGGNGPLTLMDMDTLLREADVAEYAAGKIILVSDFLEFVETEVDLEDLFRYPERDIRKAG